MSFAPIVLFVFDRPDHTEKTLESLMNNNFSQQSDLFIYADGPKKNSSASQIENIKKVRNVIREKKWCATVTVYEQEENKGLSLSVIEGVTKIVNKFGRVIVLEDDLVTSPFFLQYMNEALEQYESNENVACISGYVYPIKKKMPETYFIKGADCWGWATWQRSWKLFENDGLKLLTQLQNQSLTRAFDFDSTYPYTVMLQDYLNGKNDSWAIRWYASAYLQHTYCLYPSVSLVQNIGFDGSGIHSGVSSKWDVEISYRPILVETQPVIQNKEAYEQFKLYFQSLKPSLLEKIKNRIKRFFQP